MAAADGFRLSHSTAPVAAESEPVSVIVPARAMQELARIAKGETEPIRITINEGRSRAVFHVAGGSGANEVVDEMVPAGVAQSVHATLVRHQALLIDEPVAAYLAGFDLALTCQPAQVGRGVVRQRLCLFCREPALGYRFGHNVPLRGACCG